LGDAKVKPPEKPIKVGRNEGNTVMKSICLAIALGVCSLGAQAQSDEAGAYLGFGYGQSRASLDHYQCGSSATCTSSNAVARVYVGYKFNTFFGLELGSTELAKFESKTASGSLIIDPGKATELSVLGRLPFGASGLTGFVRFGVAKMQTTYSDSFGGNSSKDNTVGVFGAGLEVKTVLNGLAMRLELDTRSFDPGPPGVFSDSFEGKVHTLSLGLNYTF
jgi:hypothetical protein